MTPAVFRIASQILGALLLVASATADAQTSMDAARTAVPNPSQIAWSRCAPDSRQLRATARELASQGLSGDEFLRGLVELAGLDPDFVIVNSPMWLPTPDGLSIGAMFPLSTYAASASEAIRKREPVAAVTMPAGIVITVTPETIDSPDIIKVVVERDGRVMPPTLNQLKQTEFTTRMGVKFTRHAGALLYPCSAFELGGTVTITAIPANGENIVRNVGDAERYRFWPKTNSRAIEFYRRDEAHVVALLELAATNRKQAEELAAANRKQAEEIAAANRKQAEERASALAKQEEERAAAIRKQDDERAVPIRSRPASALLRMTAADVKALFGPPAKVDGTRWTYLANDDSGDQLLVYLSVENPQVWHVTPDSFDLKRLKRQ